MSFDVFLGYDRHCNQAAEVSCPQCGVRWHFNTVKGARVFAQNHANECGECHTHGAVEEQFFCVYDEPPAPEAWGPPDVVARELGDWEEMMARATSEKARASRRKMAERARISLNLAAEKIEERHPELKVCRESGLVSPR